MSEKKDYQIYILDIVPPIDISLTHPTTEQEEKLMEAEESAFNGHRATPILPSEGFKDITPPEMIGDTHVAVVANDEGGGAVVFSRQKSVLRRGFEKLFRIGDAGTAPIVETFTLPPYDRVPIGKSANEFAELTPGDIDFPQKIGERMVVTKLVVRRLRQ